MRFESLGHAIDTRTVRSLRAAALSFIAAACALTASVRAQLPGLGNDPPASPTHLIWAHAPGANPLQPAPARPYRRLLELVAPRPREESSDTSDGTPFYCFDPARPVSPEIMAAINRAVALSRADRYPVGARWIGTEGAPITLTWSFVPDGTLVPSSPGNTAPSNLFAAMDAKFSAPGQGGRAAWINQVQACFNRWAAITGISYVRVRFGGAEWDDGAAFPEANAQAGARGDIRIGGCNVDGGGGGILAFAYLPFNGGDMVLDTTEDFGNPANNYRILRNTVMHEHGHTLGMPHVCSSNSNQLMEPFLDLSIDGPQHDDLRSAQRMYGDVYEPNDTLQTATDLEVIPIGQTYTIGPIPNGGVHDMLAAISVTGDVDLYKFTVSTPTEITVAVEPRGFSYDDNSQDLVNGTCGTGNTTNSSRQADLTITILDAAGTVLLTQNSAPIGLVEVSNPINLGFNGVYYVGISAAGNVPQTQDYRLEIRARQGCTSPTVSPLSQVSCVGGTASFTVAGSGTSVVRWRRNGVDIPNSNVTTLTLNPVTAASGGTYECAVFSNCGVLVSNAVTLDVTVGLPSITGQPASQTICEGTSTTFSVAATDATGYQWRRSGVNIGGATGPSYVATAAGNYDCVVSNICGSVTSTVAVLTRLPSLRVTQFPSSQTVCAGQSTSFFYGVTGASLTYQWLLNNQPIPGATSSTYTIPSVTSANAGTYLCAVESACGSSLSLPATLTVNVAPAITSQPAQQTVCPGQPFSFSVAATGTPAPTFRWRRNGSLIPGATSPTYSGTASSALAGAYVCEISNLCGTATTTSVNLTLNTTPTISVNPAPQNPCPGRSASFSVTATGVALAYQWRRNGVNIPGATASTYTIAAVGPPDLGNYSCFVSNACGDTTTASAALTLSGPPTITTGPVSQSACIFGGGGPYSISVIATGDALTYQWRVGGGIILGATSSTLTLPAPLYFTAYDCVVTNPCGSVTSSGALFTPAIPPSITAQPSPQSACENSPASFSVTATGTGTLTYQWRLNGSNIPGANSATYVIAAVTTADIGSYDCVIINACGTTTSSSVALTVNQLPTITGQPASATICPSAIATFSVVATGPSPTYQWQIEDPALPGSWLNLADGQSVANCGAQADAGATLAMLSMRTPPNYFGPYCPVLLRCVVSSTCGSVTSNTSTLTICPGDFNCQGGVGVQDIFDFLAAWFAGSPIADFNGQNGVTVQDIFDFLAAWFAGC